MARVQMLELNRLSVGYGTTTVLDGIDLAIGRGEFVALLGASGCGKTTLLRAVAGFVTPSAGSIRIADRDVTRLPPDKRGVALVFQSYALWPHMTVDQNIGYGLKLQRRPRDEIARRVADMETMLGLDGLGGRKPGQLSGGQRQRVALGRALAIDPEVLLLDEPLSSLDARIRQSVRHDIRALQQRLGITAIHVTHDREEAMVMADRIVILDAGRIAQQGTPEEVYNHPASAFVAAFMGAENQLQLAGDAANGHFAIAATALNAACAIPINGRRLASGTVHARFRAEAVQLLAADDGSSEAATNALDLFGHVEHVTYPGGSWRHAVKVGETAVLVDSARPMPPRSRVRIRVPSESLFLFDRRPGDPPIGSQPRHAGGERTVSSNAFTPTETLS
jgi:ABC-type Fe3+/spermidine/putrescine transport system ATPase subunit